MTWQEIYARLTADREDCDAFGALEKHVRRWAWSALRPHGRHAVDDAVADTCSRAVLSLHSARGVATFVAFVHGHFRNVCRPYFRRIATCSLDRMDLPAEDAAAEPAHPALGALWYELGRLPERERRAIALRYFEDQPASAIAAELRVTEVNARRIVCRAMSRLRRRLEPSRLAAA